MSDSRQLSGSGLWRMGLYASQGNDGSGPRLNYTEQILDARAAGIPLASGSPLSISSLQTEFDIGSLGCSEFTHLCAEFAQGDSPSPGFKFEILGGGRTITECLEVECAAGRTLCNAQDTYMHLLALAAAPHTSHMLYVQPISQLLCAFQQM